MHKAKSSRVKAMIYMDAFSQRLPYPTLGNYRTNRHKSARTLKKKMSNSVFPSSPAKRSLQKATPWATTLTSKWDDKRI